jgi:hypothetical protein
MKGSEMDRKEIQDKVEAGDYDTEYAEYIMDHGHGDRVICNGNTLVLAMEDFYLWEDFIDFMETKINGN